MLAQRRRRWANINSALGHRLVFTVMLLELRDELCQMKPMTLYMYYTFSKKEPVILLPGYLEAPLLKINQRETCR